MGLSLKFTSSLITNIKCIPLAQSQTVPLSIAKREPLHRLRIASYVSLIFKLILDLPLQVPTRHSKSDPSLATHSMSDVAVRPRVHVVRLHRQVEVGETAMRGWHHDHHCTVCFRSVTQDSIGIMTNRDARARHQRTGHGQGSGRGKHSSLLALKLALAT